jgi:hypothetical protein
MSRFVQIVIAPNDATWQGRLLALDDHGSVWSPGAGGKWEWFCGEYPEGAIVTDALEVEP